MSVTVVVGNPKPKSRTYEAANLLAEKLTGAPPDHAIDLTDLGAGLLDWDDPAVAEAVDAVKASSLVIFASPTYKATYTGLLKLFIDRFSAGALNGVVAVPLMLGGHWKHYLASDMLLKPVLVEIGATMPARGLFLLDSDYAESAELAEWLEVAKPQVASSRRG